MYIYRRGLANGWHGQGWGAEGRTRPNNWTLELLIVPTESSIACCCPLAHPSLPLVSNSNYVETAAAVVRGETKNGRLHGCSSLEPKRVDRA